MPDIADVVIEYRRWDDYQIASLAENAFGQTLEHLGMPKTSCEIALLACDDNRITKLNGFFRDKPSPTNVLSWPETDLAADIDGSEPSKPAIGTSSEPVSLGDIAIAYETCMAEADQQGISKTSHISHLLVHGCLHLLGYDHISDKDAALMEGLEVEILAKMGIANPY